MIYTLGETLMDIIFDSVGRVTATPGGAMFNTAVSLARKDVAVRLISELGNDKVSSKIVDFLQQNRIETSYINFYKNEKTSLALAFLDEKAKPSYSFYKAYPNQRSLKTDVNFFAGDYLLFGSVYSLDAAIRKDVETIVKNAKSKGVVVIYDPNIRHAHHLKNEDMRNAIVLNMKFAGIVKGSDEDFTNIFGKGNPELWAKEIKKINPQAVVVVTMGDKGSVVYAGERVIDSPSLPVEVVSTVGAGDAFNAGMLYKLYRISKPIDKLNQNDWNNILKTATQFATMVCGTRENYIALSG